MEQVPREKGRSKKACVVSADRQVHAYRNPRPVVAAFYCQLHSIVCGRIASQPAECLGHEPTEQRAHSDSAGLGRVGQKYLREHFPTVNGVNAHVARRKHLEARAYRPMLCW
jgi:hypothetical protein